MVRFRWLGLVALAGLAACQNNTIELDGTPPADDTEGVVSTTGPQDIPPATTVGEPPLPVTTGPGSVTTSPTDGGWDTGWTDGGWTDGWDTDWTDGGWDADWTDGWEQDLGVGTDGTTVSFFADVAPILQTTCAPNCHQVGGEWPTLELMDSPWFSLVGVPSGQNSLMNYVEPGSLDNSYLWHKINGTMIENGGSGLMMPKAKVGQTEPDELTPEQFEIIAVWILEGAPNN